jgi:hypothetical protein
MKCASLQLKIASLYEDRRSDSSWKYEHIFGIIFLHSVFGLLKALFMHIGKPEIDLACIVAVGNYYHHIPILKLYFYTYH